MSMETVTLFSKMLNNNSVCNCENIKEIQEYILNLLQSLLLNQCNGFANSMSHATLHW